MQTFMITGYCMKRTALILLLVLAACSPKKEEPEVTTDGKVSNAVYFDILENATKNIQSGNEAKAETYLNQAINIAPQMPMAYYMKGILYYNRSDIEKSGKLFAGALVRCNDEERKQLIADLDALTALPVSEEENRLIEKAEKANVKEVLSITDKTLALNTMNTDSYFLRAEAYEKSGNNNKAEAAYLSVLQIHPAHLKSLNALNLLYKKTRKPDKRVQILETTMSFFGKNPETMHEIADIYMLQDKKNQAVIIHERNIAEFPEYYPAFYELAKIYATEEKKEKALSRLKIFTEADKNKSFPAYASRQTFEEYSQKARSLVDSLN